MYLVQQTVNLKNALSSTPCVACTTYPKEKQVSWMELVRKELLE